MTDKRRTWTHKSGISLRTKWRTINIKQTIRSGGDLVQSLGGQKSPPLLKTYNFVISGLGQATTGAEAQFWLRQPGRNIPHFFPPDFCPSPFLTRVWGITTEKLWN